MTKKTKMVVGAVAVLGLAYYLWKKSQDGGMASMSGYSNFDGVRMSSFANASGMGSASTGRRQKCQVTEKDGSTWEYNATYGSCRRYGGTLVN
jgi:hypothetical protein